ncbi:hypothetical protein ACO0LO_22285 [Undibacterium sp. TJN25]|uniref:hypothetical protein n=1 Tax=Undibacterium sp. TJN25 TaxID=3413056 RepID=UPI003BF2699E
MASAAEIAVRCFESVEEIRDFKGYHEGNPLTTQSYRRLVGYYNLPAKMHCCVEKSNGNLCKHEHGKGWVVEKQDGTCTLMGKDCANDKFGADPKLIKDILNYTNAIKRQAKLSKILAHLEKRSERMSALAELRSALEGLYARVHELLAEIGTQTTKRLQDMYRSRSAEVTVIAVKYREHVEDGRMKKERSAFTHRLGLLNGLAIVSRESYTPIYIAVSNILAAFDAAEKLSDQPKKGEVDALVGRLDDFEKTMYQGNTLLAYEAQFMGNNMELLCFLVDDRAERYKCARFAMHQSGVQGGKDNAKIWLSDREADLCKHLAVDQINIR